MRILVLGAGLQGSACAYDLLRQEDVESVTLADIDPDRAAAFLGEDDRLRKVRADFADGAEVDALMAAHDIALSAAPYYFNGPLAAAAVRGGCHFSDLGGNTGIVREQIALDAEAKAASVVIAPDVGLAPGMINIIAAEGIRRLDEPETIRMYVGGLPQNPIPPLNYQVVYSLEGVLDYYTTPSWILRDGMPREIEPLSEIETLEFEGIGELEAFHTAGGASLQPWDFADEVRNLQYKTLRYPGHARIMDALRALGLWDLEPIDVKGAQVVPRDAFIARVRPLLTKDDEPDMVVLRVVAEGRHEGEPTAIRWDVVDYADTAVGISAMERTTGFTLAIVGLFFGRGVITARGAAPAYRVVPYEPYVEELEKRGIRVRLSE
jgi:lysine 6-dehydrogenase